MMSRWNNLPLKLASLLLIASLLSPQPCQAAQVITLRYGLFGLSVPIADLHRYAETQQATPALHTILRFLDSDTQQALYTLLHTQLPLDVVTADHILNQPVGVQALTQLSQVIAEPKQAQVQALRAAIVLGIHPPNGISLLSALDAYPQQRLTIEVSKLPALLEMTLPSPPNDRLPTSALWQLAVEYQATVSHQRAYASCIFGDSISSALGSSLGEGTFNFALGGMSSVSLVEQLKRLVAQRVQCKEALIAIGTNDAWYTIRDQDFVQNLKLAIGLVRSLGAEKIVLFPAFYSTVAASHNPALAGPIQRVDEITQLITQVAAAEQVPIATADVQGLFAGKALREELTSDGVHLNAAGLALYRQILQRLSAPATL